MQYSTNHVRHALVASFGTLLSCVALSAAGFGNSGAAAFPSDPSCPGNDTRSDRLGRILPVVPECLPTFQREGYATFYADTSATPIVYPPLPEHRFQPVARLDANAIASGVDLRVENQSDSALTIQVVGETEQRDLSANEAVDLRGLPLPITLTASKRDRGALDATLMAVEGNRSVVAFSTDDRLDNTQGVVRVMQDGRIYVN